MPHEGRGRFLVQPAAPLLSHRELVGRRRLCEDASAGAADAIDIDPGHQARLMANQIVLLVLGFVLTTVVGGVLGYFSSAGRGMRTAASPSDPQPQTSSTASAEAWTSASTACDSS